MTKKSWWNKNIAKSMMGQVVHPLKTINCEVCGVLVESHSPNRKYCDVCSIKIKEQIKKEYVIKYRQENNTKINSYLFKKRKEDLNFAISGRLRNCLHKALKRYTKTGKILKSGKYGIDYKKIIKHLTPFPSDLLENPSKWHIDHSRPLCSFTFVNPDGSTNLEEVKKAFAPQNLQWLTVSENCSKGGRWKNE